MNFPAIITYFIICRSASQKVKPTLSAMCFIYCRPPGATKSPTKLKDPSCDEASPLKRKKYAPVPASNPLCIHHTCVHFVGVLNGVWLHHLSASQF